MFLSSPCLQTSCKPLSLDGKWVPHAHIQPFKCTFNNKHRFQHEHLPLDPKPVRTRDIKHEQHVCFLNPFQKQTAFELKPSIAVLSCCDLHKSFILSMFLLLLCTRDEGPINRLTFRWDSKDVAAPYLAGFAPCTVTVNLIVEKWRIGLWISLLGMIKISNVWWINNVPASLQPGWANGIHR